MSDFHEDEPKVVPAEIVEIVPAAAWQFCENPPPPPPLPLPPRKRKVRLPILLFIATCLTTLLAGMEMAGDAKSIFAAFVEGLKYAVPVMTILVCHEMGHFIQAWRHGVYASFPFFIPMLPPIGTMGAFIVMEPKMGHRRALFDIGISGPLAGLVPTIICCVLGIYWSKEVQINVTGEETILGSPLLIKILTYLFSKKVHPGFALDVPPIGFAGWVGLLITSINLFPIGQLDGGHVLYALLRKKANFVSRTLLYTLIFFVMFNITIYYMWILMLFLLILLGPKHPPTANDDEPLGWPRIILGWLTLAFIILGFTPTPIIIR